MKEKNRKLSVIGALLIAQAGLSACTTYRPISTQSARTSSTLVGAGDKVRVFTDGGERLNLRVSTIDSDVIAGSGHRVEWQDIDRIELGRKSKLPMYIGLGVVGAALIGRHGGEPCEPGEAVMVGVCFDPDEL